MRFRIPPSFHNSKTVRLHSFAFALLAFAGLAISAFFQTRTVDLFFHDRYFVVAIGHLVLGVATLFAAFAASWMAFQALARRQLHEPLAQTHFWLTLSGVLLSIVSLSSFGSGLTLAPGSVQQFAIFAIGAPLFTLGVQLVFPVAFLLSWFKPQGA